MKKIITILTTLVLGLGFSVAASAIEAETEAPADLLTAEVVNDEEEILPIAEELDEEAVAEDEAEEESEEEEEEEESFWTQNTITIFLIAMAAIIVILNLMQLR